MRTIVFSGYSGAGKTTLIEKIIPHLRAAHLTVSVMKHAHHRFDVDTPGKDSHRLRSAGAFETLVANTDRVVIQREWAHGQNVWQPEIEPALNPRALIPQMDARVDWLILEGFRQADMAKIEVWRPATGAQAHYGLDAHIVALATDAAPQQLPREPKIPVFNINDAQQIAQWLIQNGGEDLKMPKNAF